MSLDTTKKNFVLSGFTQGLGFRTYAFEGVSADRSRSGFSVRVELSLLRRYRIPLQDLPLLCRRMLESDLFLESQSAYTFSEAAMNTQAVATAERIEATRKRKPPRRVQNTRSPNAWGSPQV